MCVCVESFGEGGMEGRGGQRRGGGAVLAPVV